MNGISTYRYFIVRLTAWVGLLVVTALFSCLLLGALSPHTTISAFTTNAFETTDVWILDVNRMVSTHIHVTGHADYLPVWSPEQRQIIYYPRTR